MEDVNAAEFWDRFRLDIAGVEDDMTNQSKETSMVRYKFRCEVENATKADLDRWLANYAHGPHSTYQATKLTVALSPV